MRPPGPTPMPPEVIVPAPLTACKPVKVRCVPVHRLVRCSPFALTVHLYESLFICMNRKLSVDKNKIADFCRRHHITRLAIFGSALREDFGADSDVDVLVDFESGYAPGFFRLFDIEQELSALLDGRKVDLRTPEDLSRYFRDRVVALAEVQYVRG